MLVYVPLDQIDDNPYQERLSYDDVPELAGRIAAARSSYPDTFGLMQVPRGRMTYSGVPSTAEKTEATLKATGGGWPGADLLRVQLAFGHRRLRAMRHLHQAGEPGYESGTMPIHIDALTDEQMLDAVWAENTDRSDISPLERARLLHKKLQQPAEDGRERTQADVGREWGMGRSTVANSLRLLDLPSEVQVAVHDGQVSQRVALDLLPVVELQQVAEDMDLEWSSGSPTATWGKPARPDRLIKAVLDGEATSDQVRDYGRSLASHVGAQLPKRLMEHDCGSGEGIVQPVCVGCSHLVRGNICAQRNRSAGIPGEPGSCLDIKTELVGQALAAQFAAKTGYTLSNNDDHYLSINYNNTDDPLLDAHDNGEAEKIVIGWRSGWGIRPWGTGDRKSHIWARDMLKSNMKAGLMIGWHPDHDPAKQVKGSGSEKATEPPQVPRPDWDTRQEWSAKYRTEVITQRAALSEAIAAWLSDACNEQVNWLLQLFGGGDESEESPVENLINFIMAERIDSSTPEAVVFARSRLAIIVPGLPEFSPAYLARLWASYALTAYWRWRMTYGVKWDESTDDVVDHLRNAYARRSDLPDDLEVAVTLAMEDLEAARVEHGLDTDADYCQECGDMVEPETLEKCSCGDSVCEDCYLEHGHLAHDEDRDPVWDDAYAALELA
jgi:ParB/RepB/Spo0J family partition protein